MPSMDKKRKLKRIKDRNLAVRERILDILDQGEVRAGDQLPTARTIAAETGISVLTVQSAIKTLARDGVLELRPRLGAFIKEGWDDILYESHFIHFDRRQPWLGRFKGILAGRFPNLRMPKGFKRGMIEIQPTITVQSNRQDYIDMSSIFREAYPDDSPFYAAPFKCFRRDGRLLGVPFIFSPRAIVFNPEIFRRLKIEEPKPDWTWDEFIATIRALRAAGHPKDRIFSFSVEIHDWMSFVFLTGGSLFSPGAADPVKIDSPETMHGLRLYKQIQQELGIIPQGFVPGGPVRLFMEEGLAMMLAPREVRSTMKSRLFESWDAVPLPSLGPGAASSAQATDLICVRRECRDKDSTMDFVRFMLSEEIQDFIGSEKYGIPVRISSSLKSLDDSPKGDKVFFDQMDSMSAAYDFDSPDIDAMIHQGIGQIWRAGADIDRTCADLASAARTYLRVRGFSKKD